MEVGPWTPIGTPSLTIPNYRPDFNAKPRPDVTPIKLLRITKAAYEHRVQSGVGAPPEHLSSRHSSRSNVCRSRNNARSIGGASFPRRPVRRHVQRTQMHTQSDAPWHQSRLVQIPVHDI